MEQRDPVRAEEGLIRSCVNRMTSMPRPASAPTSASHGGEAAAAPGVRHVLRAQALEALDVDRALRCGLETLRPASVVDAGPARGRNVAARTIVSVSTRSA